VTLPVDQEISRYILAVPGIPVVLRQVLENDVVNVQDFYLIPSVIQFPGIRVNTNMLTDHDQTGLLIFRE
jgi:hypothetical protein